MEIKFPVGNVFIETNLEQSSRDSHKNPRFPVSRKLTCVHAMHSLTTSRVCESLDFHGYAETGQTSVSIPLPRMPTTPSPLFNCPLGKGDWEWGLLLFIHVLA